MLKKFFGVLVLTSALSTAAWAQMPMGQAGGPGGAGDDAAQQMRDTMQTIIQNMMAKGMDPAEFFQQLRDGADPADIEKQLIDKGVVDQGTLDQLHNNVKTMASAHVRDMLGSTDAEWAVLAPLIQKVQGISSVLDRLTGRGGPGMMSLGTSDSKAAGALSKANRELRAAVKDPNTTADKYNELLQNYRFARDAVRAELEAARKDLTAVLTVRQESVLTDMGILE